MLLSDGAHISKLTIPKFPFMYWPDGTVCEILNMYFIDIAYLATGNTLGTYASSLTHIARYCWSCGKSFAQLTDDDFYLLAKQLKDQRAPHRPTERARNNNTIRGIISRTILFLLWYQKTFVLSNATPLIGRKEESAQITVTAVRNYSPFRIKNSFSHQHPAMPPSESTEPKGPMAQQIMETIGIRIDELAAVELQKPQFIKRFQSTPEILLAQLDYIRIRRHFMIWMMKRTGLRPSELVAISVKEHETILQTKRFLIPTGKQRLEAMPMRSFGITLKDAAEYHRYATGRRKYCATLARFGITQVTSDALFLTDIGTPIEKSSLEKDFSRLAVASGFEGKQVCLSMFRHRFITFEVLVHLKEFMSETGKTKQLMTKTDEESILKRVATKTGHGSLQSLWRYIDLAWAEIGVWGNIDKAIGRLHAGERLHDELRELKRELDTFKSPKSTKKLIADISEKLQAILEAASIELLGGSE